MKKIASLLIFLLSCIAFVDIIWFFFPDVIPRNYAIVLTIPVITICYFLHVEVKNMLYLLALAAFMIADYYFFVDKALANGIISSGIALSIYGIIVLIQSHYISTRRLLLSTVPFLAFYMLPFIFFVEKIKDEIFGEIIFYTFAIGYFAFMSSMAYISKRTPITKKLMLAGLSTGLMGLLFGTFIFLDKKPIYTVIANILFIFSHYKMWEYVITKDAQETSSEI